uniref:Ion_trans domain-containing protein n=1 Tax=Caenorhabditis tropicalis TaxID=1561998 RepID=A0A1I7TLC7_9PELO
MNMKAILCACFVLIVCDVLALLIAINLINEHIDSDVQKYKPLDNSNLPVSVDTLESTAKCPTVKTQPQWLTTLFYYLVILMDTIVIIFELTYGFVMRQRMRELEVILKIVVEVLHDSFQRPDDH